MSRFNSWCSNLQRKWIFLFYLLILIIETNKIELYADRFDSLELMIMTLLKHSMPSRCLPKYAMYQLQNANFKKSTVILVRMFLPHNGFFSRK